MLYIRHRALSREASILVKLDFGFSQHYRISADGLLTQRPWKDKPLLTLQMKGHLLGESPCP